MRRLLHSSQAPDPRLQRTAPSYACCRFDQLKAPSLPRGSPQNPPRSRRAVPPRSLNLGSRRSIIHSVNAALLAISLSTLSLHAETPEVTDAAERSFRRADAELAVTARKLSTQLTAPAPASPARKDEKHTVILVMEQRNETKKLEWRPKMTLVDALVQRTQLPDFRLLVHIWRQGQRMAFSGKQLQDAERFLLQPNDVVVLGTLDDGRVKRIEGIPEVAKALGEAVHPAP